MAMRKLPVIIALGHAFRSLRSNMGFAWYASWPWLAILLALNLGLAMFAPSLEGEPQLPEDAAKVVRLGLMFLATGFVSLLAFSSIAVTWHRYILLDEVPPKNSRIRVDGVTWRYFGYTILIALIMTAVMLPIALLVASLGTSSGQLSAFQIGLYVAGMAVIALPLGYRLSLKLPAIALGQDDFSMRDALSETRGNSAEVGLFAVLVTAAVYGVGEALGLLTAGSESLLVNAVFSVVQLGVSWLATLSAITSLTSLYGFFVEKRDF